MGGFERGGAEKPVLWRWLTLLHRRVRGPGSIGAAGTVSRDIRYRKPTDSAALWRNTKHNGPRIARETARPGTGVAIRPRPVAGVVGYLVLGDTPLGVRMHNNTSRIQPQLEALGQTISISASKQLTIVSRYYASEMYETVPKLQRKVSDFTDCKS